MVLHHGRMMSPGRFSRSARFRRGEATAAALILTLVFVAGLGYLYRAVSQASPIVRVAPESQAADAHRAAQSVAAGVCEVKIRDVTRCESGICKPESVEGKKIQCEDFRHYTIRVPDARCSGGTIHVDVLIEEQKFKIPVVIYPVRDSRGQEKLAEMDCGTGALEDAIAENPSLNKRLERLQTMGYAAEADELRDALVSKDKDAVNKVLLSVGDRILQSYDGESSPLTEEQRNEAIDVLGGLKKFSDFLPDGGNEALEQRVQEMINNVALYDPRVLDPQRENRTPVEIGEKKEESAPNTPITAKQENKIPRPQDYSTFPGISVTQPEQEEQKEQDEQQKGLYSQCRDAEHNVVVCGMAAGGKIITDMWPGVKELQNFWLKVGQAGLCVTGPWVFECPWDAPSPTPGTGEATSPQTKTRGTTQSTPGASTPATGASQNGAARQIQAQPSPKNGARTPAPASSGSVTKAPPTKNEAKAPPLVLAPRDTGLSPEDRFKVVAKDIAKTDEKAETERLAREAAERRASEEARQRQEEQQQLIGWQRYLQALQLQQQYRTMLENACRQGNDQACMAIAHGGGTPPRMPQQQQQRPPQQQQPRPVQQFPPLLSQPQTPPPPRPAELPRSVVTLIANPKTVDSGAAARLSWASVNTRDCTVRAIGGNVLIERGPTDGSVATPALSRRTVFEIVCSPAPGARQQNATSTAEILIR